jgi:hypothetical protein
MAFACESVGWKRRLLGDMLGKQGVQHCLFEDLCELPSGILLSIHNYIYIYTYMHIHICVYIYIFMYMLPRFMLEQLMSSPALHAVGPAGSLRRQFPGKRGLAGQLRGTRCFFQGGRPLRKLGFLVLGVTSCVAGTPNSSPTVPVIPGLYFSKSLSGALPIR